MKDPSPRMSIWWPLTGKSELANLHADSEIREMLLKMANQELKHKEKMEYLYANTAFPQTSGG